MPVDIRNFFAAAAKKPTGKKKVGAADGAPAAASAQQPAAAAGGSKSKPSSSSSSSSASKKKSSGAVATKSTTTTTTTKKQLAVNNDSDTDDTDVEGFGTTKNTNVAKSSSKAKPEKKRKVVIDSSDSDDDHDDSDDDKVDARNIKDGKKASSSSPKKTKGGADSKEMSPEELFGDISSSAYFSPSKKKSGAKPSPKKKPKLSADKNRDDDSDMDDSDDDDDFVPARSSPAKTNKKTPPPRSASKKRTQAYDDDSGDDDDNSDDDDDDFKMNDSDEDHDNKDDDFDPDDEDFPKKKKSKPKTTKAPTPKKAKTSSPKSSSSSPAKRAKKTPTTPQSSSPTKKPSRKKSPASTTKPKIEVLEPTLEKDSFDTETETVAPECLAGLTFVMTGQLETLSRDGAIDLIKTLGGRVTGSVSSKTTYLVVGEILEDQRPYYEGSKYRKATGELKDKVKIVMGEKKLYGLCKLYQDKAMKEQGVSPPPVEPEPTGSVSKPTTSTSSTAASSNAPVVSNPHNQKSAPSTAPQSNPYANNKKPVSNPYAKAQTAVNPYAKNTTSNPYAKNTTANPYAKPSTAGPTAAASNSNGQNNGEVNGLWVDRHKPDHTRDILGNKSNVTKLQDWLKNWEKTFVNNPRFPHGKTYSNPKGPWKAALLSGPPGIGKTTTATLVSKEAGRDLLEFNASDARSKKTLQQTLGSSIDSQSLAFSRKGNAPSKQKVIIMDEVDGMGAGDRSGMAELIQIIKKSKTPIICICNDRQSQKIKSLLPYCMDLRFSRPTKTVLANRVIRIAAQEGLTVERNAAEAIAESCGNDVRQVLNLLQMWSQKRDGNNAVTYKGLKDREKTIQKDEILRVSLFDAAKVILEGRRDLSNADGKANVASLMKRSDAFFVDYSFTGLIVQQNYPKILNGQFLRAKQSGNPNVELAMLEQMHLAAESMSDYNLVESEIRGGDGNWGLLPASAIMAVKCGYHAGGEDGGFMPGFPEFTAWMGKNSTMGKNYRLLNELHHHMNYHVSANSQELRQTYVPVIRDRIFRLLKEDDNSAATEEAIQLMDDYGLSREDIAERLEAFVLGKPDHTFDDLDSKQKAAFTRAYNAGKHMSQALVSEQGAGPKKKKTGGSKKDPLDLDVIDEDGDDDDDDDDDDEEDDEKDMEKLRKQFKSKGRKPKAQTAVSKKQKKNNKK